MNPKELRIVFMGTPEFAVPSLRALVGGGYNVVGVVTSPDKPAGRGQKLHQSEVKLAALELGSACKLTNASDTDWLDCQKALRVVGLEVENLLNDWLVARWHTKHGKKARYD